MRRNVLILLLFFVAVCTATAGPVTKSQALQTARAFAQKHGLAAPEKIKLLFQEGDKILQDSRDSRNSRDPRESRESRESSTPRDSIISGRPPAYYVFGLDGEGFVIVAGDDSAYPVLGYSDHGNISADAMPDNLRYWLDSYAREIAWSQGHAKMTTNGSEEAIAPARQVVTPLLPTLWSQNEPYNLLCPQFDGQRSLTGCVATAMAQVMYYHQWPQDATTIIPSYSSEMAVSGQGTYKTTVAELPPTTFDWDHMQYKYSEGSTAQADTAVARLMQYCGAAVKMQYAPTRSGAQNTDCIIALNNYFGYAGTITELERDCCQPGTWDELIYHEISQTRPVIISGGANNGFHAFVCDGFDGDCMFHINWGWEGTGNGYFRLQALNPTFQGAGQNSQYGGFTTRQCALVGISPTPTADEVDYSLGLDDSSVECMSLTLSGSNNISYKKSKGLVGLTLTHEYKKHSIAAETYDVGVALYKDDVVVERLSLLTNRSLGCYHWTTTKKLNGFGTNLDDGTYQLMAISRRSGTSQWYKDIYAECNYADITIANGKVSYTNVSQPYIPEMEVIDVEQRFDCEVSSPKQLRITVKNTGSVEYIGPLYLFVDGAQGIYEQLNLGAGAEDYIDMFFKHSAGNCPIVIATDKDKQNIIFDGIIQLINYSTYSQNARLTVEGWQQSSVDEEKMEMYGRDFTAEITLANHTANDFAENIRLRILAYETRGGDDEEYSYLTILVPAAIPSGETVTLLLEYPNIPQEVTEIYYQVFNGSQMLTSRGYYRLCDGYAVWDGNGRKEYRPMTEQVVVGDDVTAADFSQKNFSAILPGSNPNTIYYFSLGAEVPTTLAGHNVVKKEHCDTLTLTAGYDYYIPKPFVASHAHYTRTFDTGADGKGGWSTIVLPYAVTTVVNVASGDTIEWFRVKGESGKQFWLREFARVVGNDGVDFDNADRWRANMPYLIAVPGQRWGTRWNLMGKPLRFMADNVRILSSQMPVSRSASYEFVGTTGTADITNAYVLNDSGNAFEYKNQTTLTAGQAYFRKRGEGEMLLRLKIE
ncbi:MAG: C10 family peptidase [Prevotella sp.]|nr:C10 family peptidase [Prevotella sp.]